jgi:hypothetical protein
MHNIFFIELMQNADRTIHLSWISYRGDHLARADNACLLPNVAKISLLCWDESLSLATTTHETISINNSLHLEDDEKRYHDAKLLWRHNNVKFPLDSRFSYFSNWARDSTLCARQSVEGGDMVLGGNFGGRRVRQLSRHWISSNSFTLRFLGHLKRD